MAYKAQLLRNTDSSIAEVIEEINRELSEIQRSLGETTKLPVSSVEPPKPRVGHIVYADGTNWDPGDGEGLYLFSNGVWVKQASGDFQPLDATLTQLAALIDPNADRILFWDDSAGDFAWLTPVTPLSITTTSLSIAVGSDSAAGIVEGATDAEVWAATADKFMDAALLETAAALVALVDAGPVAVNWDNGVNFSLTVTAARAIGNPTNGQPGTWRTILVQGNNTTDRTITFDTQFLGETPTITDCDDTKWYLLMIYCVTTSHFVVSSKRAKG